MDEKVAPEKKAPGAVSMAAREAARLDRRIAAKDGEGELHEMENTVMEKEHVRTGPPAVVPGVTKNNNPLVDLEESLARKNASHAAPAESSNRSENNNNNKNNMVDKKMDYLTKEEPVMTTSSKVVDNSNGMTMVKDATNTMMINTKTSPEDSMMMEIKDNSCSSTSSYYAPENMPPPVMITTADHGVVQEPDVEFGVYEPNEDGLAVAVAVTEEDDDVFIPSAVEYDPDAKPPMHRNRRVRLYGFLAFFALMSCAVGATIGIVLSQKNSGTVKVELHEREKLGIRETVQRLVGEQNLNYTGSPYRKAADWMIYDDPLQLVPNNTTFVQRFILAYFYFATTVKGPWRSCNPPNITLGDTSQCQHHKLVNPNTDPWLYAYDPWYRWLSAEHECKWAGIQCDAMSQVRSLDLPGYQMTGRVPEGLMHLPFIQGLSMAYNQLTGTIPSGLSQMKHLVNLELHNNNLAGTIPEQIYDMNRLVRLNLSFNKLGGSISTKLGQLRDLKGWFFEANLLTGTIPNEIENLRSLSNIRVNQNLLKGTIPSAITSMISLEEIYVSDNEFTGTFPAGIERLSLLRDFRTRRNPLLGGRLLDDNFWSLNLFSLDLRGCNFTGTISPAISNMRGLRYLRLSRNPITGTIPAEIASTDLILEELWLDGTQITGTMPPETCDRQTNKFFSIMTADCLGGEDAQVDCECCTWCCYHGTQNCADMA